MGLRCKSDDWSQLAIWRVRQWLGPVRSLFCHEHGNNFLIEKARSLTCHSNGICASNLLFHGNSMKLLTRQTLMAIEYEIANMHVELLVKKLKVWYRKGIIRFWNNMRYSSKEPEKYIVLGAEKDHERTFFLLKKTVFSCHFTRTLNSVEIIKGITKLDTWQIYCNRPVTKSGSGLSSFWVFVEV